MLSILRNKEHRTTSLRKDEAFHTRLTLDIYTKLKINLRILSIIKYLIKDTTTISVRLLKELSKVQTK